MKREQIESLLRRDTRIERKRTSEESPILPRTWHVLGTYLAGRMLGETLLRRIALLRTILLKSTLL